MILIISTCADKLSELEFVKPIVRLIGECVVKHYSELTEGDFKADKIIITGTALKDFEYLSGDWSWIKDFKKPLMGVCAGFQVIARELGEELINKTLIGVFDKKYFVTTKLINGSSVEVLEQHEGFTISFKKDNIIAYAYHPEVLNQELIRSF